MADWDKFMSRLNPLVVRLLRSPFHRLASSGLLVLQVRGVRSGRLIEFPVGYQRSGDAVTVLVSKAPRKQWWRNFRQPHPATLIVRGKKIDGRGQLMDKDSTAFREVLIATLLRVPGLPTQFGLARSFDGQLSDSQWTSVRAQAEAVVFTIGENTD